MKKSIWFIQGAGEGSFVEDQALVDAFSATYDVDYPQYNGLEKLNFAQWAEEAEERVARLDSETIIVAHSLGGPAILKLLSQRKQAPSIRAFVGIAMPYKCRDGEWGTDDFALDNDFADRLPATGQVILLHSSDDEWVPFEHLSRYAEKLPHAIQRPVEGYGHAFVSKPLPELPEL